MKVNIDQEGFATTNGLKLQRDAIAASNSPVIDNLRKAGAVILGRNNCPAFSYRWFTTNLIHGDTKNPRDATLTPGGSSGGAGAAVAAGIGHIAHGTDIAGSIRYPAPSRPKSQRYRVRSRAPSAISASRWRRCPLATCAIPGGCRRLCKVPTCQGARRYVSIPTASIRSPR